MCRKLYEPQLNPHHVQWGERGEKSPIFIKSFAQLSPVPKTAGAFNKTRATPYPQTISEGYAGHPPISDGNLSHDGSLSLATPVRSEIGNNAGNGIFWRHPTPSLSVVRQPRPGPVALPLGAPLH
ncbi:hypothetical protein TNIN_108841 [Trichonephila inaurata madagascariensis]|uniref:Uncharacterized protein n=1 Tax=Trichonephila inaurata madagascariensis TaxID=2747483 RepID=A0A8X7BZC7_9ARAC|nr:hypothetical protein TNIN_108841 [Trichonephila inaurata madagascariensis]